MRRSERLALAGLLLIALTFCVWAGEPALMLAHWSTLRWWEVPFAAFFEALTFFMAMLLVAAALAGVLGLAGVLLLVVRARFVRDR